MRDVRTVRRGGNGNLLSQDSKALYPLPYYVSELLGKATIDTNTYGKSTGKSGNYSTNYQISGRELLTPDEVRMLDNHYALLFVRGERPVMDFKYDILKHPNVAMTVDGSAGIYRHGEVTEAVAAITFRNLSGDVNTPEELKDNTYELLSEEDIEAIYVQPSQNKEDSTHEKQEKGNYQTANGKKTT